MAGYSQTPLVDASGAVIDRTVAVAPTSTVILAPFSCWGFEELSVVLTNSDATQELNAWVEMAPTISGPWDQSQWTGLEQIAALETRVEVAVLRGRQYARITGTASGAGLNCRIWALKVSP